MLICLVAIDYYKILAIFEEAVMLNAFLLLTALSVSDMSNTDLEKYYWDCDTSFMQGSLGGQDMNSCLQITEQF